MFPTVEHHYRFDSTGKLDADDWMRIPRAELREDFVADAAFGERMVQAYFDAVRAASIVPFQIEQDAKGVRYRVPLGKTALVFTAPEQIADGKRVETSWVIAGGFMLAHRVGYGGRFYIGAEWDKDDTLKLYSTIRRYPPRLINWFGVPLGMTVYRQSQARVHQKTSERFLKQVAEGIMRRDP